VTTPTRVPPTADAGRAGADRIVVVDDDDSTVALMTELLTRAGVSEVHGVTDAREAVRVIREVDADLVVLDLMMPHVNGYEVLARLRDGGDAGARPRGDRRAGQAGAHAGDDPARPRTAARAPRGSCRSLGRLEAAGGPRGTRLTHAAGSGQGGPGPATR